MTPAILKRADEAERTIARILARSGRRVERMKSQSPFDLRVDGHRVEVKTALPRMIDCHRATPSYRFNIHRHGILLERTAWYIFRLERAIEEASVYVLLRAPIRRKTLAISERSLHAGKWNRQIEDFNRLCAGGFARVQGGAK